MGAYSDMDVAIAGLIADVGDVRRVESWSAAEQIAFGAPLFAYAGGDTNSEKKVYNLKSDVAKIVWDADFVTSNTIDITVNGVAASQVTFTTDHDTTMGLVLAAVTALSGVDASLDASDANNRTLYIRTVGLDCTATEAVAAGASQADGTITAQTDQVFVGIAAFVQKNTETAGQSRYETDEAVSALYRGIIWSNSGVAVNSETTAYLALSTALWSATSTDLDVDAKYRSSTTAAGLVKVEVEGQKKPFSVITWT